MDPTIILGGMKLLGGLFGKKPKTPSPRDNLLSQAQGAREAADKYGFNPLTMLQYGQTSGSMASAGPPLASMDLIMGGLEDIFDVTSGASAQRRQADELKMDLLKLQVEQARSGVIAMQPRSAANFTGSPMGNTSTIVGDTNVRPVDFGMSPNWLAPGRDKKVAPLVNTSGVMEVENSLTAGKVSMPGDGSEPWGIDEVMTAAVFGVPQAAWNVGWKGGEWLAKSDRSPIQLKKFRSDNPFFPPKKKTPRPTSGARAMHVWDMENK